MLSRKENAVMSAVYGKGIQKETFLISPQELKKDVSEKIKLDELDKILTLLSQDGYMDVYLSSRHGEKVYCIGLTPKGRSFKRNGQVIKRTLLFKLAVTVGFAVLSFVIGLLLKAIF